MKNSNKKNKDLERAEPDQLRAKWADCLWIAAIHEEFSATTGLLASSSIVEKFKWIFRFSSEDLIILLRI